MTTILTLPFPPSVNSLYDGGKKTKRRFISDAYKAWIEAAGWALASQPAKRSRFVQPVEVIYSFCPPDERRRDVFNYEKPISDLLVKHGILADDSLIHRGTVEWRAGPPVSVTIKPMETL